VGALSHGASSRTGPHLNPLATAAYWNSLGSDDTSEPQIEAASKASEADAADVAVAPGSIIERLDVVEDIGARKIASLVDTLLDPLFL